MGSVHYDHETVEVYLRDAQPRQDCLIVLRPQKAFMQLFFGSGGR